MIENEEMERKNLHRNEKKKLVLLCVNLDGDDDMATKA